MRFFNRCVQSFILAAFLWINPAYSDNLNPLAPLLILEKPNEARLPRNFRSYRERYKLGDIPPSLHSELDLLTISGSAQFSENQLKALLSHIPAPFPIYIIDLRQESHGFLNGNAVSWYIPRNWINIGKKLDEIEYAENQKLQNLLSNRFTILN